MEKKLNGHPTNGASTALVPPPSSGADGGGSGDGHHGPDEQDVENEGEGPSEGELAPAEPEARVVGDAPQVIAELAAACVRHVQKALGVTLDFTAETLPLLDHYLAEAQKTIVGRSEDDVKAAMATLPVLVQTAGAYFGEVVRRRYPSWWRTEGDDPMGYRVELETVYLAFSPMLFMYEALARDLAVQGDQAVFEAAQIEMDEEDQKAAAERLAELEVSDEEYYAPSTRLEAIDVCVATIRARRMAEGDPVEMALTPEDYET